MKNTSTRLTQQSAFSQQWLDAWNSHNIACLLALYDETFTTQVVSEDYSYHHHRAVEEMALRFFTAFPDIHFDLLETVEQEDKISMLWVATGTHKGAYLHIPPTGKTLQVNGASFLKLKDSKIIQTTFLWDGADMLRQMGLLPEVNLN